MDIMTVNGLLWYERVILRLASAKSNEGRVEGVTEENEIRCILQMKVVTACTSRNQVVAGSCRIGSSPNSRVDQPPIELF